MGWAIKVGKDKWLVSVDEAVVRLSDEPRMFRSKSYAERTMKKARDNIDENMVLIEE